MISDGETARIKATAAGSRTSAAAYILEAGPWWRKESLSAHELQFVPQESFCRDGRRDRREFRAIPLRLPVPPCLWAGVRCVLRSGLRHLADARHLHRRG